MQRALFDEFKDWLTKNKRKPLILRGARQVGKTWFVRDSAKRCNFELVEVNFEENPGLKQCFDDALNPEVLMSNLEVALGMRIPPNALLFFDEIQACPEAYVSLKFFSDKKQALPIVAAGSHLGILERMEQVSHPVGYVDEMTLYPMSFREFLYASEPHHALLAALDQPEVISKVLHEQLMQTYRDYLFVGGLPESVLNWFESTGRLLDRVNCVRYVQRQLLALYKSDFAKYHGKSALSLVATWEAVARQLHVTQSAGANRFTFKGVLPGKKSYAQFKDHFQCLAASGLIYCCPVIDHVAYPLKVVSKDSMFKAYYFDTGILLCELEYGYQALQQKIDISYKGFLTENYVASQLKQQGLSPFCYKTKSSEVEFIVQGQTCVVPIEVKNNHLKAKSLDALLKKYPDMKAIKLSVYPYFSTQRVENYPLYQVELAIVKNKLLI